MQFRANSGERWTVTYFFRHEQEPDVAVRRGNKQDTPCGHSKQQNYVILSIFGIFIFSPFGGGHLRL